MRARLVITALLALLLASCGDDASVFSTTAEAGSTTTTTTPANTTSATGPTSSTTTEATTTTEAPTTTTITVPSTPLRWSRVLPDEEDLGGSGAQEMWGVAVGTWGAVAVGEDESAGDGAAAVWYSPEGFVWQRVLHDEAVFGGAGAQEMLGVTAWGTGAVAVGSDESAGDGGAAVWYSPDPSIWSDAPALTWGNWTRWPHDEAVFGGDGDQGMVSVTAVGSALVAVGYDYSGGDGDAAVWVSADGSTWARVPHDEAVFGGDGDQEMASVTAVGSVLVAVGYDGSGGDEDAAAWYSADGLTWSRVAHDEAVFGGADDQHLWGVATGGPGVTAVGYDYSGGDGDAAVWVSADGSTWARVPHDEAVFGGDGDQEMAGVSQAPAGLAAVGIDFSGADGAAAVWSSPDGLTWTRVAHDEEVFGGGDHQEMWAVAFQEREVVVVGDEGTDEDWDAAVWVGLRR